MNPLRVTIITILLSIIMSSLVTFGLSYVLLSPKPKTNNELIKEFYDVETAAHVSPHGLRQKLDQGGKGVVIVDLRSALEYEREHIISAVNIPAYSDPNTPAYHEVDRIVKQFKELIAANPGKEIITYCYSIPCMTGRKIGKMLADNGIYVKTLIIGWNEWKYFWTLWNHEHEWEAVKPQDYIWKGKEPGVPTLRGFPSPCGLGDFSC